MFSAFLFQIFQKTDLHISSVRPPTGHCMKMIAAARTGEGHHMKCLNSSVVVDTNDTQLKVHFCTMPTHKDMLRHKKLGKSNSKIVPVLLTLYF